MIRRTLIAFAVVSILAATGAAASSLQPGGSFLDDNGNVHEGSIEAIAAAGITRGCNPPVNDLYCPSDTVTRGQMAAFLVRALGLTQTDPDIDFRDDDSSIFEADIQRLATAGITRGCNPPVNDRYCPNETVTRGQMAAFLVRGLGYTDGADSNLFLDDDGSIFEADINRLGTAGVTSGCNPPENNRYCPSNPVKRDQMATFLTRALGLTPITPPTLSTFGPGTYRIGTDLEPGLYRNEGDLAACYWERLAGFGGTFDEIIANNFDDVRQIVEILPDDVGFFADIDCGLWSNDLSATKAPLAPFTGGFWLTNTEVGAGLWQSQPTDTGCYWERLTGFSGEFGEIIANDFLPGTGTVFVQIQDTDAGFYADSECGTWQYMGP